MSKRMEQVVKIWPYNRVPQSLKRLSGETPDWVALVPPTLAWPEVEALFLRWNVDTYRVNRRTLDDGSILFSGENFAKTDC